MSSAKENNENLSNLEGTGFVDLEEMKTEEHGEQSKNSLKHDCI
jgi:hypothetical protein